MHFFGFFCVIYKFTTVSPYCVDILQERATDMKKKLSAIEREGLPVKEKVNYDILENNLDTYIDGYPFIK